MKKNACKINEIKFTGVEVIDDNNPTYACTPKLTLKYTGTANDGADTVQELTAVTYQGTKTAALTTIAPRFGSVEGGEDVTFTGT